MPEASEQPQIPAEPVSIEQATAERAANPNATQAATPGTVVQEVRSSGCTWDPNWDGTPFWPDSRYRQEKEERDSWL